jgi:hypothetical protein
MTVCATCSRGLQPEWKFCIYCGTPTGVPVTAAIQIIRAAADAVDAQLSVRAQQAAATAPAAAAMPTLTPTPTPALRSEPEPQFAPAPTPDDGGADTGEVLRAEDIPDDDEPTPLAATATARPTAKFNPLAILAVILGCLVSPLAAVFGHIALAQISRTGERGTALAWVAVVLGYLSLAALLVLGISYIVLNA